MKINRTAKSEAAAREILEALQLQNEDMGWRDRVIAVNCDGNLFNYNAACGIGESDTVLIERFECDSMGDGWEDASVEDVLAFLEDCA
jgi:hypothetical protein